MSFIFLSYFPSIFGLCLLALVTYINNPQARVNRLFVGFCGVVAFWLTALYLADSAQSDGSALFMLRVAMSSGTLMGLAFLVFADSFPASKYRRLSPGILHVLIAVSGVFVVLAFTDYMASGVVRTDAGITLESVTLAYSLQTLLLVGEVLAGVVLIWRRRPKVTPRQRVQIRLFISAIFAATVVSLLPGFVFIALDISTDATALLTSSSFFVFSFIVWIAIIRHDLFSVRRVVSRALAYVLAAGTVGTLYALVVRFGVDAYEGPQTARVLLVAVSLFVAIALFFALRRVLSRLIIRIFHREDYSSREKLDLLTTKLITYTQPEELIQESLKIIKSTLRPQSIAMAVHRLDGKKTVHFGSRLRHQQQLDAWVEQAIKRTKDAPLAIERRIYEDADFMYESNIAVIAPVLSGRDVEGYVVLGPRSSGEVYSRQDLAFLRIAAKDIGLALAGAKSFREVTQFNITLKKKVRSATKDLRTANEQLKSADEMKGDFISMASHQLRPKITAVKGFLEMLKKAGVPNKEHSELVNLSSDGVQQMSDIVVDMLDVSMMDGQSIHLDVSTVQSIAAFVRKLTTDYFKEVSHRSHQLVVAADAENVAVQIDRVKIREVILNILDNAAQYSTDDAKIRIEVSRSQDLVEIQVTDAGIGMTKEEQSNLFKKFYRSQSAKRIRPHGSGIGLYMVKKVVEAHKGKIAVESKKNQGTTIRISLPAIQK